MTDRPSFDRSLIIPIVFGVFSIFGICLVLILGRIASSRETVEVVETATPFQYIFLGTEPAIVSATPEEEETEETDENATATVTELSLPDQDTPEVTETESSLVVLSTATPTSGSNAPLNPGTYDDTESRILYEGSWTVQQGVPGAFQNSLHVSSALQNTFTIRFIGQQIRLFYQPGSGLGTIEINLDGVEFELDQSGDESGVAEWSSPLLINGTHTFVVTHLSGGAVNLDQIIVPDVLLTPTSTTAP
jgi:hypothetical protein